MECDKCKSKRLMEVYVQGRDTHNLQYEDNEYHGYMVEGLNLYGNYGDAIEFNLCMECGKIQGKFPVSDEVIKEVLKETED